MEKKYFVWKKIETDISYFKCGLFERRHVESPNSPRSLQQSPYYPLKHTKYFWRVPCGIQSGLLCYHKKTKTTTAENRFVTIATKFMSVFWVRHDK